MGEERLSASQEGLGTAHTSPSASKRHPEPTCWCCRANIDCRLSLAWNSAALAGRSSLRCFCSLSCVAGHEGLAQTRTRSQQRRRAGSAVLRFSQPSSQPSWPQQPTSCENMSPMCMASSEAAPWPVPHSGSPCTSRLGCPAGLASHISALGRVAVTVRVLRQRRKRGVVSVGGGGGKQLRAASTQQPPPGLPAVHTDSGGGALHRPWQGEPRVQPRRLRQRDLRGVAGREHW